MGALEPWASCTMRMMLASAVSLPTLAARNRNDPVLLMVAPITSSPMTFSAGMDSPVIIDSSTAEAPWTTTPSTGTFSPGRTRTRSPTMNSSAGTRSEEHTSELQSRENLVCRVLLEKKQANYAPATYIVVIMCALLGMPRCSTSDGTRQRPPKVYRPRAGSVRACSFFFNDTATTEIYTLSLHDALPI